jgi:hypothetical protein
MVGPMKRFLLILLPALMLCGCADPTPQPAVKPGPVVNPGPVVEPKQVATTTAAPPEVLTKEEVADGWISLFDGQTLFGWHAHSKADWKVEDGAIVVTSGDPGLLCTSVPFADYVLKVEFRADATTNSGVFLRTPPVADKDAVTTRCYELNIAPADNPFPTGSFVGRQKASAEGQGEGWRTFEVTLEGAKAVVKYNDDVVLEYTDPKPSPSGLIGLQLNSGKVEFRNIKLKPLGLSDLFNGTDLTGWKVGGKSKCEVDDEGAIHLTEGKGYLESDQSYDDFVLQLEARTNSKGLNSGLFFRCIPGEEMNGYESQINSALVNNDRTKPKDCGTGGIFRRVDARRVMSDDLEWFSKTIVAAGPQIAVWVNGYQVTDWKDERKPDKNPRNGLRTEAGTLQVQGHDLTTDVSLRNIRVAKVPVADSKE